MSGAAVAAGSREPPERQLALLCPDSGSAGSVGQVVRMHARLLAAHWPVRLMSAAAPSPSIPGIRYEIVAAPPFRWLGRFAHVPWEWALARTARARLLALARSGGVAAVVCHSHALAALAALPAKRRWGIPYGLVVHADIFDRPPGTYDPRVTRFYRWVTPIAYRHADAVFAVSPSMAEQAVARGAKPDRVQVLPNGISDEEIGLDGRVPPPARLGDATIKLLYVGRLSPEKGIETLLRACSVLAGRGVAFRLRVIGEGPLAPGLARMAWDAGLAEHIDWAGPQPRASLGAHYRDADVTVVPSLSEPQGLVALESLASGTPVIASATGGLPMMVEHEGNGLLVPPGDFEALAAGIQQLALQWSLHARLARAARRSVETRFSWPTVAALLVKAVAPLMGTR